ncbi:GNAT family N-acetyltransferase [Sphaerisporangium rufum]|uniref:GNAT family N-acetyltransferase n=1 Tax=Sphaerisporangium rufum TaxID=1381558 RepID=UPI0019521F17|nr:GNAT family N-acetyltransferase [Sphaerisporangium rufum]
MSELRIEPVEPDGAVEDWRHVHNVIVPPAALSPAEVEENVRRYRLEVAYLDDVLVGCTTVRPPENGDPATVIVRVLPEYRRRGFGAALYTRALAQARELGGADIRTVIWAANEDGVRFAQARGFTEVDREPDPEDGIPFLTWHLTSS